MPLLCPPPREEGASAPPRLIAGGLATLSYDADGRALLVGPGLWAIRLQVSNRMMCRRGHGMGDTGATAAALRY